MGRLTADLSSKKWCFPSTGVWWWRWRLCVSGVPPSAIALCGVGEDGVSWQAGHRLLSPAPRPVPGKHCSVAKCLAISSGASSFFCRLCCLRQSRTPNSTAARAAHVGPSARRAGVVCALMSSHAAPSGGRPATGPTIWWVTKTVPKCFANVWRLWLMAERREGLMASPGPSLADLWSAGVARGEASPSLR